MPPAPWCATDDAGATFAQVYPPFRPHGEVVHLTAEHAVGILALKWLGVALVSDGDGRAWLIGASLDETLDPQLLGRSFDWGLEALLSGLQSRSPSHVPAARRGNSRPGAPT